MQAEIDQFVHLQLMRIQSILLVITLVLAALGGHASALLFNEDLDAIESQFPTETELIEIVRDTLTSSDNTILEIPTEPVNNQGLMPIMGLPTFVVVFVPTCAVGCLGTPCAGIITGGLSIGYINHFTNDPEETKKATFGGITGVCLSSLPWLFIVASEVLWII